MSRTNKTDDKTQQNSYSAKNIKSLSDIDGVRERPNMYIGATHSEDGAHQLWKEIYIGNAGDEITAGYATTAWTIIHPDGSIEVRDNGRGIPCDEDPESPIGDSVLRRIFTELHSGSKFDDDSSVYKSASVGMNGVGTCVTNALSKRLDICVFRDGHKYEMSFKRGIPGTYASDDPESKFTPTPEGKKAIRISKDNRPPEDKAVMKTGTIIHYWPDPEKWDVTKPDYRRMCEETKALSYIVATGTFILIDEEKNLNNTYQHEGGIKAKVEEAVEGQNISPVIAFKDVGTNIVEKPIFEQGNLVGHKQEEEKIQVEGAFAYIDGDTTYIRGYVNTLYIKLGGTSVDGFRRGISRAVGNYIKKSGLLTKKDNPNDLKIDDIVESGLIGDISVMIEHPEFTGGQTKDKIDNPELLSIVSDITKNHVTDWLNDKKNQRYAKNIAKKCIEAMRLRLKQKQERERVKKTSEIEKATSMPAKLNDCQEIGSEYSELLICEGDSALGSIKGGRDATYQAVFPVKGKILNTFSGDVNKMLSNDECAGIITALGGRFGKDFDITQTRYHNVIIYADADEDGNHIRCLMITFFWKYMRPLIEEGRFYTAVPPLYMIKTLGKNTQVILCPTEEDKDKTIKELKAKRIKFEQPSRLKGLGEMDPDKLWDTSLNPERRTLRRITIDDALKAEEMLNLAMSDGAVSAKRRREWLTDELGLQYDAYD